LIRKARGNFAAVRTLEFQQHLYDRKTSARPGAALIPIENAAATERRCGGKAAERVSLIPIGCSNTASSLPPEPAASALR
jgi:hypothetical protein